jgi:hypothetical protein
LRLPAWRVVAIAAILAAIASSNAVSDITNYRRMGGSLPAWEPFVWEFSSVLVIGALIPAVDWLVRRVPVITRTWYRSVPIHLLATLPFSIVHVAGMVGLRKLAYAVAGGSYQFGPVLSGWVYEYRKDFVTYWLIAYLYAAMAWLSARRPQAVNPAAGAGGTEAASSGTDRLDRLVVRKLNREFILDVADIARIEACGNYVTVHANASSYQLRGSLAGLAKRLDGRRFVQIHRTQIVNLDHIREIQPWDHGDYRVLLNDGSVVKFSRRYRARLEHLFHPPVADHSEPAARP